LIFVTPRSDNIIIRRAGSKDSKAFLDLVIALAQFEHLTPPSPAAKRRLVRDAFRTRRFKLLLAFEKTKAVGYALYFFTYSSFLARPTLYLEDIFVLENYRGKRIGKRLFGALAREARNAGCGRMEWAVLAWNSNAIKFYKKLGARHLSDWHYYRLDASSIAALSRASAP
jgi:GNAT superfamily N-acetyltransferase